MVRNIYEREVNEIGFSVAKLALGSASINKKEIKYLLLKSLNLVEECTGTWINKIFSFFGRESCQLKDDADFFKDVVYSFHKNYLLGFVDKSNPKESLLSSRQIELIFDIYVNDVQIPVDQDSRAKLLNEVTNLVHQNQIIRFLKKIEQLEYFYKNSIDVLKTVKTFFAESSEDSTVLKLSETKFVEELKYKALLELLVDSPLIKDIFSSFEQERAVHQETFRVEEQDLSADRKIEDLTVENNTILYRLNSIEFSAWPASTDLFDCTKEHNVGGSCRMLKMIGDTMVCCNPHVE